MMEMSGLLQQTDTWDSEELLNLTMPPLVDPPSSQAAQEIVQAIKTISRDIQEVL